MNRTSAALIFAALLLLAAPSANAGLLAAIVSVPGCYSICGSAWAICYAAAGLVAGTVTGGLGAPASAIACNAGHGACMKGCVGAAVVSPTI